MFISNLNQMTYLHKLLFISIVPRQPPRTNVGSFLVYQNFDEVVFLSSKRELYIYWQDIDEKDMCGLSFKYQVFCQALTDDEMFNKTMLVLIYLLVIFLLIPIKYPVCILYLSHI